MASSKERQRWDRWYTQVTARMERQKSALTRMALCLIEARAALEEIAAHPGALDGMRDRAQAALERMAHIAAANQEQEAESEEVPDPRNADKPGHEAIRY